MASLDFDSLTRPLSDDAPCGSDLEDTQQMAAIDAFRVFGQSMPLPAETDWRAIRDAALEALETSRDFRLLAHVAAAELRSGGLASLINALRVAAAWLESYFDAVFPRVDDDAVLRKNAINYFADRMAVIDALRRAPLVSNRQLGAFSLRHLEIVAGELSPGEEDGDPPTESQVTAAFTATPQDELAGLVARLDAGLGALKSIESSMVASQGVQAAPDTQPLVQTLARMREHVAKFVRTPATQAAEQAGGDQQQGHGVPGEIRSRDDAMRTLDAVADFFRRAEPSSPIPLFLDRAKRLIDKNFLEVLADLAPDSLAAVKHVGGIRDEEE